MWQIVFESWEGRELMESYESREDALREAEEYEWFGGWSFTDGEQGFILISPEGEEEAL